MSYDLEKVKPQRKPITIVGVVADKCSLTAGVSPCTATETGDSKCFNTRKTCNDTENYTKTTEETLFCDQAANLPQGIKMFPALDGSVTRAPTTTTGGKGIGYPANVTVKVKDFPHDDRGIDPYLSERTYAHTARTRGTYWGKWLARNPYYEGRMLKIYTGYLGSSFSWDNFQVEEYDISSIDGPTKGMVTVVAKDILARTFSKKAQYPQLSTGYLSAGIAASASTATLNPVGIGDSEYPSSGYVTIGKEVKSFTRSGDVLTFTGHGLYGTEDKSHAADDTVQICATWDYTSITDALYEALVTGAGIPDTYIPYDNGATGTNENWDDELDDWLSDASVYGILMKPESVHKVVSEWSRDFMFDIWWDSVAQKVYIKALSPERPTEQLETVSDGYEIIENSLKIKRETKKRISTVQLWYNKIDYSEKDEIENFVNGIISSDVDASSDDKYGSDSIEIITSRWIKDSGRAGSLAGRTLARFSETPEIVSFEVTPKDEDKIGQAGRVAIQSWQFPDFTGLASTKNFQITKIDEVKQGERIKVECLTSSFSGNYFFFTDDDAPDYADATEDEKKADGYICDNTGIHPDGASADKMI